MATMTADVAAMSGYGSLAVAGGPHQHQWSPYVMNSGTVMAICGKDFAVIAGDTRMSVGYQIQSRNVGKLFKVSEQAVLGTGGHCQADTLQLQKLMRARIVQYEHANGKKPKTSAVSQLVSQMLYNRRFFPLLTKNIVINIIKDAFTSAGERDITTGDHVDIWVIDKDGVHAEKFDLKYD
ncbi:nucleophile aminohydrolase [Pavlovales sp. CCMP2436]|nr:nucleophile aminohydrolase [Pavlovales sp. CCMP2436]